MNESAKVVQDLVDAYNDGDQRRLASLFAPDYVNHDPPGLATVGADREGQLEQMRIMRAAFPDRPLEVHHILADGDLVVLHDTVEGIQRGPLGGVPASGRPARITFIHIFRVKDGKLSERWGLSNLSEAMRALASGRD